MWLCVAVQVRQGTERQGVCLCGSPGETGYRETGCVCSCVCGSPDETGGREGVWLCVKAQVRHGTERHGSVYIYVQGSVCVCVCVCIHPSLLLKQ